MRDPERGEIAVFDAPPAAKQRCTEGGTYLERAIGIPGDRVAERNGVVYLDGKRLPEGYVSSFNRDSVTKAWPRLGKDQYFMMGDNGHCPSARHVFGAQLAGELGEGLRGG